MQSITIEGKAHGVMTHAPPFQLVQRLHYLWLDPSATREELGAHPWRLAHLDSLVQLLFGDLSDLEDSNGA